jgi:hypothetical protein
LQVTALEKKRQREQLAFKFFKDANGKLGLGLQIGLELGLVLGLWLGLGLRLELELGSGNFFTSSMIGLLLL